jgi:zinc/manganese transport system permease protein
MEILSFLAWPFLACLLLILIHAYFGVHILARGIIFVDLALAQFIGIGLPSHFCWKGGQYPLPCIRLAGASSVPSKRVAHL